jgi:hypothetical protein
MLIKMTVPCCDFTDTRYPDGVEGGGYLARGATGRWCVVMYAGPEQVARHIAAGGAIISAEEAYAKIEAKNNGEYADF